MPEESASYDMYSKAKSGGLSDPELNSGSTVLLIVDMQYLDTHRDYGLGAWYKEHGLEAAVREYFERLETVVIPNLAEIQVAARGVGVPVIHTRIMGQSSDGADFSRRFKELGFIVLPESEDATFLPTLAPLPDEMVLNKTTAGCFGSTDLHGILRRMGIETLVIGGVMTNSCVESTVRVAADLDYRVVIVEDGTAALRNADHEASLRTLDRSFAVAKSTSWVLDQLNKDRASAPKT